MLMSEILSSLLPPGDLVTQTSVLPHLANNQGFDHVGVDIMQARWELARLAENTALRALGVVNLVGRCWAAVAIDTPNILTNTAVAARCHAGDKTEGSQLVAGRFVRMEMGAFSVVGAFGSKEMNVAQFDLLHAVHLSLIVVLTRRIDALAGAVTCDDFFTVRGLVHGGLCNGWRRSSGLSGPVQQRRWWVWLECWERTVRSQC